MGRPLAISATTIGKKAIVAVTGVVLFGFLVVHLAGNLQVFLGAEAGATAMHEYAVLLRKMPTLLWAARLGLLASFVLHVWAAISLVSRNADARPIEYAHRRKDRATTYAARTMHWSGPIVGLYLLYHLLHLTFGYGPAFDHQNPYNNVVHGFMVPWIALVYIVANLLLGMHLFHGGWSFLQSLGASHPRFDGWRKSFSMGLAFFLTAGNVAIPMAVLTGIVAPADEAWFRANHCAEELAQTAGECDGGGAAVMDVAEPESGAPAPEPPAAEAAE